MKVNVGIGLWSQMCVLFCLFLATEAGGVTITKLEADFERPYIYAIAIGQSGETDSLLIIDVKTEKVVKSLSVGEGVTDMAINYGEGRLYVTNWGSNATRVVDLETQQELTPLMLGTDVYKINAGRPGRIYYEEEDQWIDINIINSLTGANVGHYSAREGDGEIDPTGNYYYHCDNNISNAHIHKYDISTDSPVQVASSLQHPYGSRNLVLSGDGSRLFWGGYVYDKDLEELGNLGSEIYATTLHGDLAFGSSQVFNAHTGDVIYTLPVSSTVQVVSGNQEKLFQFNAASGEINVISMSDVADIPGPVLNPIPSDSATVIVPIGNLSWDISPVAIGYEVYFGVNETSVAAADMSSPEYLGRVTENSISMLMLLDFGRTYYWRIDQVGFSATTPGPVWSFTVAPIIVDPNHLTFATVTGAPNFSLAIELTSNGLSEPWEIAESIPWLSLEHSSGMTTDSVEVIISPAGMSAGVYMDSLWVTSGSYQFAIPVEMELIALELTQMVTDYERPYLYGLHRGSGNFDDAFLIFINTESDQIEKVIPIGSNPTDMTINYGEGKLYITNWRHRNTRVVDLSSQEELQSLYLGTDVYKINAGRPGRIYYEQEDQWIDINIINSLTSAHVGTVGPYFVREGDGEIDPTGSYYYHCENNSSGAKIRKYDISTDSPVQMATSLEHPYGSRNLVLSGDGSRLFWQGYVYDKDLEELGNLGSEIYATTLHGDLAFGSTEVFNAHTGDVIYTLPVSSAVMAVSGDQKRLFLFNGVSGKIDMISMSDISGDQCQEINLPSGWNLISWNEAYSAEISALIDNLSQSDCVDMILSFDQGGKTYDPDLPQFSTLSNTDYSHGYWFKMNCDADLTICGPSIDSGEFIQVNRGWNLVSYWPEDIYTVEEGLLSILNKLSTARGFESGGLTWTADHPGLNTLTELKPHNGYWLNLSEADILTYPGFAFQLATKPVALVNNRLDSLVVSHSWMSLYGEGITVDNLEISDNSLLEVFTLDGTLCGANRYLDGRLKFTPVYGSEAINGTTANLPKMGDSLELYIDGERIYPNLIWSGSGKRTRIGQLRKAPGIELPTSYQLEQNYPNPFNPMTRISFTLPKNTHVELAVYNVLGQRVATLVDENLNIGVHEVTWDASPVASGIYIYRMRAGSFKAIRKMILLK